MAHTSLETLGIMQRTDTNMPAFFIGHGSPMNGIEHNIISRRWKEEADRLPLPVAILCISAHWLTRGTHVTAMDFPPTIHDFGGFPDELYRVQYPAPGSPQLAQDIQGLITSNHTALDHEWGLDHGAWTVIRHMYPDADIPVLQLSIDFEKGGDHHYRLGQQLAELRKRGVLIIGSGNMVHNLRMVAFDKLNEPGYGFDWALEMDLLMQNKISSGQHRALIDYGSLGAAARLAIPTPEHYLPLLYILGMRGKTEDPEFFNQQAVGGSITMTSVRFG